MPAILRSSATARRNAVLLYCEQFQHAVASFAGGPARTPNLERLAESAVQFETACTTTGLCSPSRAALFTGRLGHRTGLDDNCSVWHSRLRGLPEQQTTLIEWARRKDYLVGYFGKWHLGLDGPIHRGAQRYSAQGFDRYRLPPGKSSNKPDFSAPKRYYGRTVAEKPGFYTTAKHSYEQSDAGRIAKDASSFLDAAAQADRPFFLTASFQAVHPPYDVPTPYNTVYPPEKITLPASLSDTFQNKPAYQNEIMWPFHDTGHMSESDWRRAIAYYHGFVTMLDRALGEIVDALAAHGLLDSTMVVVVADHGDMVGAHNRFDKGPYAYDEVMRVPLLIRSPGTPSRRVSRHVSTIDLNATLTEWMQLDPGAPNLDSRSLLPLLDAGDRGWNVPDEAFYRYEWYNGRWFGIRAIRTPAYKYSFNPCGVDELYDLRRDPGEMKNLAGGSETAAIELELQERLLQHLVAVGDQLPAARLRDFLGR
jgi:arylsulfatase A-like enzyme